MKEVLNAREAARILGVNATLVRRNLKSGFWNFGRVLRKEQTKGKQDKYVIYTRDMCKYFDIPIETAERMCSGE